MFLKVTDGLVAFQRLWKTNCKKEKRALDFYLSGECISWIHKSNAPDVERFCRTGVMGKKSTQTELLSTSDTLHRDYFFEKVVYISSCDMM